MTTRPATGAAVLSCSLILLVANLGCVGETMLASRAVSDPFVDGGPPAQALACTLSGPHPVNNLTVYLIHGPDQPAAGDFLTLPDALGARVATVSETGSVGSLRINNHSHSDVLVHGGEIVKGGRQDRTLAFDLIVAADSNGVPVDAFCVEAGRWSGRAGESAAHFGQASSLIASHELRLAVMDRASQSAVWGAVADVQDRLRKSIRQDVASAQSPSSLQLTLENQALQSHVREYTNSFASLVDNHADAIGYACVINGRIKSAEVYATHALFRRMWPRLIAANAVESIALLRGPKGDAGKDAVHTFVAETEGGKPAARTLNDRTRIARYTSDASIMYETVDASTGSWVHRTYLSLRTN